MNLPLLHWLSILGLLWISSLRAAGAPDVLFIAVDDMNDWISLLDPESPIKTPNLERLANRGMLFTRAYCISAACNPSRAATMTGLRPSTTGVYGNKSDWRGATPDRLTLMQQFQKGGYLVKGAGKIFHHHLEGAFHDDASFDDFQPMAPQNMPPQKLNQAPDYGSANTDWGAWPPDEQDTIDFKSADYCIEALRNPPEDKPLFLACGIFKPHSPFFAPPAYHEGFEDIAFPVRKEDDWSDLPSGAEKLMAKKTWFWKGMQQLEERIPNSYHDFIRSYAACCTFADAQIGRVLDALEASPRRENTIVVLWSDHGFHLGEKDHIEKFALWEKSNHIPFIVVAPGVTEPGSRCEKPVDLTALYPTLLELCDLSADDQCDGKSLKPLLENPEAAWELPALMTYGKGNHAVRTERWRYIHYADGTEELYDHAADPHEWDNVAGRPENETVLAAHRQWLPRKEAKPVPDLKAKAAAAKEAERPNILLIVSEDNGPELSCYGDPYVKTPVLDDLAANGVRFDRAYVPQAGCSQSRAAFMTSLYPHQNGQIGLATWKFRMYDGSTPNLVRSLKEAGYRTGIIGKLHVNPASAFPFDFKQFNGANFNRKDMDKYAETAREFIRASDDPFYLAVNYPDAHRPFIPEAGGLPEELLTGEDVTTLEYIGLDTPELRQQVADYYNCMMRLDALIGDLTEELKKAGKFDNTLIVYIGDHGADIIRGKRTSFEGGIRIPMIMHWGQGLADLQAAARENSDLVSTLDLFPTFLEAAGAKPIASLEGRSLLPLVKGEATNWREYLYTEYHTHSAKDYYPQRTVEDKRFKLIQYVLHGEVNPGYDFTVERYFTGLHKTIGEAPEPVRSAYLRMRQPPEFELYDLEADPFEFTNLADDPEHAETFARLKEQLLSWRRQTNDPLLNMDNVYRLQKEIADCFVDGEPDKAKLNPTYPDYFFQDAN